jgi:hypothetical protein
VKRDDDVALGTTGYTDITLTVAWHAVQAARRAPAAPSAWKDNDTAKLVNDLRDCAVQYHATAQLRERIAHLVRPLAARLAGAPAAPVPQVSIEKLEDWKRRVNTLATCGLKADRYRVGSALKQDIADAIAAAPQPPEAGCSVSNGETQAAPVQLPEYGIDTANHAGIRVRGYTEQQVRELLAAAKVERDPLTDSEIESATGAKQGTPLFLAAKGFAIAIERAHGIGKDKA